MHKVRVSALKSEADKGEGQRACDRKLVARVCRVLNGRASQIEVACRILHYGDQFIQRKKTVRRGA